MKYYNLKRINKKKGTYNIIIGERSNGKTYSTLQFAIQEYFKSGIEVAIIRRWKEDIRGRRAGAIFTAIINDGLVSKYSKGEYSGIHYYNGKFYPCNYDDKGKPIFDLQKVLGHTFALSDNEHNKSLAFPNVGIIIFDEFLTKGAYLKDEFILFMNTISTIIRQRDNVKIYMLGNTVNKYSPYFEEMGITNIKDMKQGDIDIYKYGNTDLRVVVEYCDSLKKFKKNNHYFAFDNPKLNMITGGKWELDIYPHLLTKYKPKDVLFTYFILFNAEIFQCEIIQLENDIFTYIHIKTTDIKNYKTDLIYTLDHIGHGYNIVRNIYKPINTLQQNILKFFKYEKVYYQNNTVGESISNYLKLCRL